MARTFQRHAKRHRPVASIAQNRNSLMDKPICMGSGEAKASRIIGVDAAIQSARAIRGRDPNADGTRPQCTDRSSASGPTHRMECHP